MRFMAADSRYALRAGLQVGGGLTGVVCGLLQAIGRIIWQPCTSEA